MEKVYRYSVEARAKMSKDRKGRKISEKTKAKMRLSAKRGVGNNQWKGGVTPLNLKIRGCPKMKEWRISIFERDKYTCAICGTVGSGNLNADHHPTTFSDIMNKMILEQGSENAYEKSQGYSLFWDINNGRTLCEKCHMTSHKRGYYDKPKTKPRLFLTHNGERKSLIEWAKITGIYIDKIHHRYIKGMSSEQILSQKPVRGMFIEYMGQKRTLSDWCQELRLPRKLIWTRLYMDKWSVEDAFTHPVGSGKVLHKNINKSNNRWIEYNGERKILFEWAVTFGISPTILWKRLNRKWSIESALTTPTGVSRKEIHKLKKKVA